MSSKGGSGSGSGIFTGTRVLALVSTAVPHLARYITSRRENLLATSSGRHVLTYSQSHLSLLSVSPAHSEDITALAGDSYHVFSAAGSTVYAWRRGRELKHEYRCRARVHLLLAFGLLLITVDEDSLVQVWYIKEETLSLEIPFKNETFKITAILHPNAYLNKILLGSEQGGMQLWNINTSKVVHSFEGWGSPVRVLRQAPALDVVAVGLANGKVVLHNLRMDRTVMELGHGGSSVTSLSFRTDGHPIMVVGTEKGKLVLWNLEERKVVSSTEAAHDGPVANATCLPSEPLVVTNSVDNSLKLWIFDMPDGGARLLRFREGHSSAPTAVRFVGRDGDSLLSAGSDGSMRILSTAVNHHAQSLGKASYDRKKSIKKKRNQYDPLIMPPVTMFDCSARKDERWDDVAAIHSGIKTVTTWSLNRKKMGKHKIKPKKLDRGVVATCLVVTHCGNFVCIGYSNGSAFKYNMQSGLYRGKWGTNSKGAHEGAIRGIETDHLNSRLITAGSDGRIKIWPFFESKLPIKIIRTKEAPSFTRCHRESNLLAVCCEDFSILIVDIDTSNVVRKFEGHLSKINDACFSHDSRWLITTSMDCTFCTWDIPTGQLIDIFKVDSPCVSLSMSKNGDHLATAHSGLKGVYLWANRTLYIHVNLRPIKLENATVPRIELPTSVATGEALEEFEMLNIADEPMYKSPEQIDKELVTLSNLPSSRWQNLLNLDIIKERNRPKERLKVPKAAPFFLPTVSNIETGFDLSDVRKENESRSIVTPVFENLTSFGRSLDAAGRNGDFSKCISEISEMGPSRIHFEIQSLDPTEGGSEDVTMAFLKMLAEMLKENKNFETAQSYLGLFLKIHGNRIAEKHSSSALVDEIQQVQRKTWNRVEDMLLGNLSIVKAFKDMSYQ